MARENIGYGVDWARAVKNKASELDQILVLIASGIIRCGCLAQNATAARHPIDELSPSYNFRKQGTPQLEALKTGSQDLLMQ
jgi:hypothetical protein